MHHARACRAGSDRLNGFIVQRGRELGVPTPVKQTLHALVKRVESGYENAG